MEDMGMIIKLLGTAAFEGIPALFCNCEICRESRALAGRNIRKRSSAIIDNKIALDFTNDTLSHVIDYNLDLSQLEHLFITHSHSDHFNYYDLKAKLGWFTNSGNPVLNVYANENCVDLAYSNVKYCDTVNEYIKFTTTNIKK
jgi:phosphoribosyl 1,2-cyclic phosphate phosphodiesterase